MRHTYAETPDRHLTEKERLGFAGVLLVILVFVLAFGSAGCELKPTPSATTHAAAAPTAPKIDDPAVQAMIKQQREIIGHMSERWPTVEIKVKWQACGTENSFYHPREHEVVLCTEMYKYPDTAGFWAAHEAAHAITDQLAGTTDEFAADELAALELLVQKKSSVLLGAALWHGSQPDQGHWVGDEHPSNRFRAWFLTCMVDGTKSNGADECKALLKSAAYRWTFRLTDEQITADEADVADVLIHLFDE